MTMDRIALRELLEEGPDHDLLREMIGFLLGPGGKANCDHAMSTLAAIAS